MHSPEIAQFSSDGAPDGRESITVERLLVWVYHRQRAHVVAGKGLHELEMQLDADGGGGGRTWMDDLADLGIVGGGGPSACHLHPDAELVHRRVLAQPRRVELIYYALTLGPPDWMPGAEPIYVRAVNKRGQPMFDYPTWDRGRRHGTPKMICKLSQADIDRARRRYAEWHDALLMLVGELTALKSWRVLPPQIPSRPWLDAAESVRADAAEVFSDSTLRSA